LWGAHLHASPSVPVLITCGAGTIADHGLEVPFFNNSTDTGSQRWAPKVNRAIPTGDQGIAIRLTRDR
jgi:hypothetical protein